MFYLLIAVVALSRFLPHPPNVACVGALGLFAGCYLSGRRAYLVPVVTLLISDCLGHLLAWPGIRLYNPLTMALVYGGVLAAVPVGRWLQHDRRHWRVPAGSLGASTLFFALSNLGVWLAGWYPMSLAGLATCYANAIPFFGYTIAGDLLFTLLLFGSWELSRFQRRELAPVRVPV